MAEAQKAGWSGKEPKKKLPLQDALRVFWQSGGLEGQLEKISDTGAALPLTMGVLEGDKIIDVPIHDHLASDESSHRLTEVFGASLRIEASFC